MNIKELNSKVENFIPPEDFGEFFADWKKEQTRVGFNWSVKSEELFRKSMITGMVFLKSSDDNVQEAPQKEGKLPTEKLPETGRKRARRENKKEELPEKTARTRNNVENSDTISTGNRTRTRTRASN